MALLSTVSRSNWNLEMLVFVEGGKPEYPEKNPRSRAENQQQTQRTYDAESGNRTRATLVGGECSHHCAIPAPCSPAFILVQSDTYRVFEEDFKSYFMIASRATTLHFESLTVLNSGQNMEFISLSKSHFPSMPVPVTE